MSHRQMNEIDEVRAKARDFVENFKQHFQSKPKNAIYNTDQSGFNLEQISGRTLEIKGTQKVSGNFRSMHSKTHSYTIMPTISADGELLSPLYIIFQEPTGKFGDQVKQTMFQHADLYTVASTSGKITKVLLKEWFTEVIFPHIPTNSVIIVDSLTTYKDRVQIDVEKPDNFEYEIETLPPNTTSMAQPLDVYFFRQYKSFVRRVSDEINLNRPDIKLHIRNTCFKIQLLTFNQFSSPRFYDFIRYSWYKCGYTPEHIAHISPNQFCFEDELVTCSICEECSYMRCSWCKNRFCFNHFFIGPPTYHYCREYVE